MVKKDRISRGHLIPHEVSRLIVSHAIPRHSLPRHPRDIIDAYLRWLRLHQPIAHTVISDHCKSGPSCTLFGPDFLLSDPISRDRPFLTEASDFSSGHWRTLTTSSPAIPSGLVSQVCKFGTVSGRGSPRMPLGRDSRTRGSRGSPSECLRCVHAGRSHQHHRGQRPDS